MRQLAHLRSRPRHQDGSGQHDIESAAQLHRRARNNGSRTWLLSISRESDTLSLTSAESQTIGYKIGLEFHLAHGTASPRI